MQLQVALTLHGFTFHVSQFTRGLCFCQMNSHYVMHYMVSSLYTIKKILFLYQYTMFHFTRVSLYTIHLEKQKSCKVRATCNQCILRGYFLLSTLTTKQIKNILPYTFACPSME